MKHYTYWLTDPVLDMFYIGVHSCTDLDNSYKGSVKNQKWGDQWPEISARCTKQVLGVFYTRAEAVQHEILLHDIFDVGVNPKFFNQSKQTSKGFDTSGMKFPGVNSGRTPWNYGKKVGPLSQATKLKMSQQRKGVPKPDMHKEKIRAALAGRIPSQQCIEAVISSNKRRAHKSTTQES